MTSRMTPRLTAIAALSLAAITTIPACILRWGVSTDGGDGGSTTSSDEGAGGSLTAGGAGGATGDSNGSSQAGAGSGGWIPEEEEAVTILEMADPDYATRSALMGEYTSSALAALIEANFPDPAAVDVAVLETLVDQYAPDIWQDAQAWAEALDASIIQAATITPKPECQTSHGRMCSYTWGCLFENVGWSTCILTGCGKGACPACPSLFDLDALVVQKWCSYTCISTKNESIVGLAIHLKLALNGSIERCFLFEKPVP